VIDHTCCYALKFLNTQLTNKQYWPGFSAEAQSIVLAVD